MREFNKVFVIALPRCGTVSLTAALGAMQLPIAHLGQIWSEQDDQVHLNSTQMENMHERIRARVWDLPILEQCRGLADYPACAYENLIELDRQYPGSLFINVRRDNKIDDWLRSVEVQFVGLQSAHQRGLLKTYSPAAARAMRFFRNQTFGTDSFDRDIFEKAYHLHQSRIGEFFRDRQQDLLEFDSLDELASTGLQRLSQFLECPKVSGSFPYINQHSQLPKECFFDAIQRGEYVSTTGAIDRKG